MATVTLDQMKDQLVSVDEVIAHLQKTEPLVTEFISSDSKIKYQFDPDWAHGIDALDGTEIVGARMTVDGVERPLTKDAALQAGGNFGLTAAYAKRIPARLTEGLLNYHYGNGMGGNEFNLLSVKGNAAAFTRPTLKPFSNVALLESTVEAIHKREGFEVPIFADYKFTNSLKQTNIRLITPTTQRVIQNTNMADVPDGGDDVWLAGIHLSNSIIGKTQTALEAYMFRWWCTNGATTVLDGVNSWSRRVNGQNDDVYVWAQEQVDAIFEGLDERFEEVQALAGLSVNGNTGDILREIFRDWNVPVTQRADIEHLLLQETDITLYKVMNAITQVANQEDLPDARRDLLMRIGGSIPTDTFDTMKAQVWREGHLAEPAADNPYEIQAIS